MRGWGLKAHPSWVVFYILSVVFVSVVTAAAGAYTWLERRASAMVEIEAAYSELELALASSALRLSSLSSIVARDPALSPSGFSAAFEETTRTALRLHERAFALILESAHGDPGPIEALVEALGPEYEAADYPEFALFPDYAGGPLLPVVLAEPPHARTNVYGYNLGSDAARTDAARRALETGTMALTEPVALSQDGSGARVSFLVLHPVAQVRPAGADRAYRGVIAAGLTPDALFAEHVTLFDRIAVAVRIDLGGPEPILVDLNRSEGRAGLVMIDDHALPDIELPGVRIPVAASASYLPHASDMALPFAMLTLALLSVGLARWQKIQREVQTEALRVALANKESDLRRALEVQSRSSRIEALGRLVGGVAHDFNNILSVVLGNLELMEEVDDRSERRVLIGDAIDAARRGGFLTKQLLSFGRRSHLRPVVTDLAAEMRDTTKMLQRVLPASIDMSVSTEAGLWKTSVDPDGLQNALLNLALNARDAMAGRGKLTIEAANVRVTREYLSARPEEEIEMGRYVCVSMTDTGTGMDAATAERAFEPYFSTKHLTEGSGMGLPSVLGFCRQSGGTCRLYSEAGVGTTVQLLLPADGNGGVDEAGGLPEVTFVPVAGAARILVAEDEAGVGRVMQRQLKQAGYAVTLVANGDAAMAVLAQGASFDLLVSDLVMDGQVQGGDLARHVEATHPEMAILLVSGYPQESAVEANGVATRHRVLSKPVPRDVLLQAVHDSLQAAGSGGRGGADSSS